MAKLDMLQRILDVKADQRIPVLAEIKPSSPSSGDLLKDRDIKDITQAYIAGGAACISVVTGRWFGGNINMLKEVASVSSLPVLRKDLIVNMDQVRESQDNGATAVLLTTKILQANHLEKLVNMCVGLGVTPFIEVDSREEISMLPDHKDIIVGITNRDISKKETDTDSGLKGMSLINEVKGKAGAVISASGINTNSEANSLIDAGFDGLLVGTSLLEAADPQAAVSELAVRQVAQMV